MSLGLLIGRFGQFLEEQAPPYIVDVSEPALEPADELARIRESYGHHIIALMLLSRADGESVASEREVILKHCVARAEAKSIGLTKAEERALSDHLCKFRPNQAQFTQAIKHLHHDSPEDVAALVSAAKELVDADGVRRPEEVEFLERLSRDLAGL